jgi:uncharacterized protein YycO
MFLFAYNYRSEQEHSFSTYSLSKDEINQLQNGDIILRHGFGMASDLIVKSLNEKYDFSHCAIICKDKHLVNVIHSVSQTLSDFDGIQSQTLSRFISDSKEKSIIVVRFKNQQNTDNKIIASRAAYYLSKKIPFDNDFNIEDSSKFYCSELIWKVIKDTYHEDIFKNQLNNKKDLYKFQSLWDTTRFEIIINHHFQK